MESYIDITKRILKDGKNKPSRAGETIALPNVFWEHNMEDGFPLLTTRQMPMKSIAVELEGFIKGITSKAWFQERGCRFWDNWANPHEVSKNLMLGQQNHEFMIVDRVQKATDDLGPLGYSFQMRRFGEAWDEDDGGLLQGVDQLADVVRKLKDSKNDRRMIVSYWNPPQLSRMALPPCTVAWGATVIGGELHLSWYQRSCDWMLGGACDIASMGLLHTLLAVETGIPAGKLSALLVDCHIYKNHIDAAKELITREPYQLPELGVIVAREDDPSYKYSIFDWTHKDYTLYDYQHRGKLEVGGIAI